MNATALLDRFLTRVREDTVDEALSDIQLFLDHFDCCGQADREACHKCSEYFDAAWRAVPALRLLLEQS